MGIYHEDCRDLKREHFSSMESDKPDANKNGALRILEIGAASGYNFEFYPAGSVLSVLEVNPFFEKQFYEKQDMYSHLKMDRFVVGFAEDMKDVADNSVDIVVSTMVLCSVRSIEKTLKEIHRVLVPVIIYLISPRTIKQLLFTLRGVNITSGSTFAKRNSNGSCGFSI